MTLPNQLYQAYVFDLDGTIYLHDQLLPHAAATLALLRERGKRTVFLSNNPTRTRAAYAEKLTRLGVPTSADEVLNSSFVMVEFLKSRMPGARLFVCGEESLSQELQAAGFGITARAADTDAVIASFDRTFTYAKLQTAFDAIRRGARFFATNGDPYCPVPGGGEPDAAAIIAAIEACTRTPVEAVVGKPSRFMVETLLNVLQLPAEECLITGDRVEIDVRMGKEAGMASALVLTGATTRADLADSAIVPDFVLNTVADLIRFEVSK